MDLIEIYSDYLVRWNLMDSGVRFPALQLKTGMLEEQQHS